MQVKITEERLSDADEVSGAHYSLSKGDVVTVSDEVGKKWLGYGWAKDTAGKHPVGERKAGPQEIVAHDATVPTRGK